MKAKSEDKEGAPGLFCNACGADLLTQRTKRIIFFRAYRWPFIKCSKCGEENECEVKSANNTNSHNVFTSLLLQVGNGNSDGSG